MKTEDIEKEFENIVKMSQSLFIRPIKIIKEVNPISDTNPTTENKLPILPLLDSNLDLISKMTRLLNIHDITKEDIYTFQHQDSILNLDPLIEILEELSILENFKIILERLNKLLEDVRISGKIPILTWNNTKAYNKIHSITFLTELNNILQTIHSEIIDILSEYNILSGQYVDSKGMDKTKILLFGIGNNVKVINIEPYNIPIDVVNFINAFVEEVEKTDYKTYLNVLYIPTDKKYRLDFTLGGIFGHRSIIIYDPDPSQLYFEHIYADANYSRTLAWQMCLANFSKESSNTKINILDEERKPEEKSLAWRYTLMKLMIEKKFLSSMAIIIYLINWDDIINVQEENIDIMSPENEAKIIYLYAVQPKYDEKEKRYTVKYDIMTQKIVRGAIQRTMNGIKERLLDTNYYEEYARNITKQY